MTIKLPSTAFFTLLILAGPCANALSIESIALTEQPTLNNVIRWVPVHSRRADKDLALLSAIREHALLHERRMRGEGLPTEYRALLSANYSSILTALIDDCITEEYGREMLLAHRRSIDKIRLWSFKKGPHAEDGPALLEELKDIGLELAENAEALLRIPDSMRTPVINGHQIWMEELLVWGAESRTLSPGDLSRLGVAADRLESEERSFKLDGELSWQERGRLHTRLIALQRLLTEVLER